MMDKTMRFALAAMALLSPLALGVRAHADQFEITVTNAQPAGGFAISPVWFGLHDGSFSAFNAGDNLKGSPYQAVAELADTGPISAAFAGLGPQITVGGSPYLPGVSRSAILDVANPAATRFLNYAAMIVPSNDFFFGNDAAHPIALFDTQGHLIDGVGNLTQSLTINIYGRQAWDAGTEVDDINFGAAFIVGDNIADHVDANGTASLVFGGGTDFTSYLNSIDGKPTPGGYDISHLISSDDLIATLTIRPVPEPGSLALLGVGLIGCLQVVRRRNRKP